MLLKTNFFFCLKVTLWTAQEPEIFYAVNHPWIRMILHLDYLKKDRKTEFTFCSEDTLWTAKKIEGVNVSHRPRITDCVCHHLFFVLENKILKLTINHI